MRGETGSPNIFVGEFVSCVNQCSDPNGWARMERQAWPRESNRGDNWIAATSVTRVFASRDYDHHSAIMPRVSVHATLRSWPRPCFLPSQNYKSTPFCTIITTSTGQSRSRLSRPSSPCQNKNIVDIPCCAARLHLGRCEASTPLLHFRSTVSPKIKTWFYLPHRLQRPECRGSGISHSPPSPLLFTRPDWTTRERIMSLFRT